ncbi:hypothetical protein QR680_007581 [Steinernema hermaphroditum]|uniref:Reverse transcriptase domain-containing protein n=1 Tax=Steinernema hermaphroditum TaxID=289476 RepID=A0AA39IG38_9BILA|nr:hypothetical protein QR680_007581 [Steinernema hermaphroditum]
MIFTKLFRPLLEHWRLDGIRCALYLDDGLIFAPTYELCKSHVDRVRRDLESAGVVTSDEKCIWEPVQRLTWLGYDINLGLSGVSISEKRIVRLLDKIDVVLRKASPSKLDRMQLAGSLASIGYVFGPAAQLKARSLHAVLVDMTNFSKRAPGALSEGERADLEWWKTNIRTRNWRPFRRLLSARRIATDASATGAGVVIWNADGSTSRSGINFTPEDCTESSTFREVAAVLFGLRVFAEELADSQILVQIDNQSAVGVIEKGSPIPKLQLLASQIFDLAETLGSEIHPVWVPREYNVLADEASRLLDRDDWGIRPEFFVICCQHWGDPTIDLFANNRNALCSRYLSRYPDIGSEGVDAFASSWENEFAWAVPPPNLIPRTVLQLLACNGKAILGIPWWPSHMFFPSVWTGSSWTWFVRDVICVERGSALFTPSTFERSIFNETISSFDFYFLLIDCAL